MSIIAIDAGGTNIRVGFIDHGRVLDMRSTPATPENGLWSHLPKLANLIEELCTAQQIQPSACQGLGLSFPGLVDAKQNRVVAAAAKKYADAPGIDLVAWAREKFGLPFKLETDGHAALLGEWYYGAGQGVEDLVMVSLGTGYGTSVIIRGRPLRGKHHQAGVLGGHFIINAEGEQCICPAKGCIEAETASWTLAEAIISEPDYLNSRLSKEADLDYETLFRVAEEGDKLAERLLTRNLTLWGLSLVNLIHAYDPERIIMGGGIMRSANIILPAMRSVVEENAWTPWGQTEIVAAQHPTKAALMGIGVLFEEAVETL